MHTRRFHSESVSVFFFDECRIIPVRDIHISIAADAGACADAVLPDAVFSGIGRSGDIVMRKPDVIPLFDRFVYEVCEIIGRAIDLYKIALVFELRAECADDVGNRCFAERKYGRLFDVECDRIFKLPVPEHLRTDIRFDPGFLGCFRIGIPICADRQPDRFCGIIIGSEIGILLLEIFSVSGAEYDKFGIRIVLDLREIHIALP